MKFKQSITIRHLRLIATLGRELSISRCAEALHTSQSAISRGLTEIESIVGARLFERTTRRFVPTLSGRNLMWHAELMLNQLDRAEADFKALSQGFANIIEVGVMAGFSPKLLARAIRLANEQAPKMTIRLLTNFADGLLPGLIQGRYDLIVTHFDVRHLGGEDIDTDLLYYEHVEVIAAQGHPLSRRKQLEWKDLIGERWVLAPTQTSSRRLVDSQLLQRSKEKNLPTVEVMGFHYAVSLIHESGMLAAMPSRFARWLEEQGLAVRLPIVDRLAPLPVCVARLRSKETSAGAILFKNCLLQVCGDEDNVASVKKRRRAP